MSLNETMTKLTNVIAKRNIVIYGTAKVGDWIEVKDVQYSELGGVAKALLSVLLPVRGCVA